MTTYVQDVSLGAADGLRVAIKDTIDIEGLPTRAGSRAFADAAPARRNAEVVDRLLAAGAHIVGKTTLHELAFGISGINDVAGTPVNARFPDLIPGGSSSGSAVAVAEGSARVAIGTDTGGSVRIPAACCGVWGIKPTYGLVSRAGVLPAASSLDSVGAFAATLTDLEWAMTAIAPGFQPERMRTARIGWLPGLATPEIEAATRKALDRAGVEVREIELASFEMAFKAGVSVIGAENWAAFGGLLDGGQVDPAVAARIASGGRVTPADLARAETIRLRLSAEIDLALQSLDALALPTLPVAPPSLAQARDDTTAVALTQNVRSFNLSGHPALAMPLPPLKGAPLSLQLVGAKTADAALCAVAALLDSD